MAATFRQISEFADATRHFALVIMRRVMKNHKSARNYDAMRHFVLKTAHRVTDHRAEAQKWNCAARGGMTPSETCRAREASIAARIALCAADD